MAPGASAKPNPERMNAAKECRGDEITPKDGRKAFGKCVREKVRKRRAMRRETVQKCRDERGSDPDTFRAEYGANDNKRDNRGTNRNAFGKCVSSQVKEMKAEGDADSEETEETSTS